MESSEPSVQAQGVPAVTDAPAQAQPQAPTSVTIDPLELQRQVHAFLTTHIPMALEDVRRMQAEEKLRQQQAAAGQTPSEQQMQEQQQAQQRALHQALQANPSGINGQERSMTPSSSAMLILLRTRQQAAGLLELLMRQARQQQQQQQQQTAQEGASQAEAAVPQASISSEQMNQLKETLAALDYRMGVLAAESGDSNLAARFFSSALHLWDALPLPLGAKGSGSRVAMTLDVCNMLASLALEQGQHQVAEGLLLRAHSFYEQFQRETAVLASRQTGISEAGAGGVGSMDVEVGVGEVVTEGAPVSAEGVEAQYTFTCFHLAQMYAALEQRARSAYFCGLTLTRQLRLRHHFTPLEWVQNCTQLASYYAGANNLPCALRCLSAARAVLETEASAVEGEAQQEAKALAAANISVASARIFLKVLQDAVEKSIAEEERKATGKEPGKDTSKKEDFMDLDSSSAPSGTPLAPSDARDVIETAVEKGPDFSSLGVSLGGARQKLAGESQGFGGLGEGEEAKLLKAPTDYPSAVVVFNRSMINFKSALEYFKAEERFSDHVPIILDISNLHKHLAYFEMSPHRAALIHLRGATRLEAVLPKINPKIYPQQLKQISYEIASIHLSVMNLEEEAGKSIEKIEDTYRKALAFLELLVNLVGPQENSVQPEYSQLFSNAVFLSASIQHRNHKLLQSPSEANDPPPHPSTVDSQKHPHLHKSLQLFSYFLRCVETFKLEEVLKEKVALAQEMIQLLPAHLEMQLKNLSLA